MSIGRALATARVDAGLSVEQVSDRTRIRRTLLLAIEQDDFSRCGGDFYARGHLKAIAEAVGVEAAPLLAELDTANVGLTPPPQASTIFQAERISRRERRNPNWSAVMAAALVAVLGIAGWQIIRSGTDSAPIQTVAGGPFPTATSPAQGRPGPSGATFTPTPVPAASPDAVPPDAGTPDAGTPDVGTPDAVPPDAVPTAPVPPDILAAAPRTTVEVEVAAATAASWLRVTDSTDATLFTGTIPLGQARTYSDPRRLRLVMGNAGGLSLTVNGVLVGTPGAPGQVVRQEFGLADPVQG